MDAVPMQASCLVSKVVVYFYDDSISDLNVNLWARPLSVDPDDRSSKPVWGCDDPSDVPFVVGGFGGGQLAQGEQDKNECAHVEMNESTCHLRSCQARDVRIGSPSAEYR